ncbi:MAG: acyl-CoA dehydrogenase family protein [Gammaproteobacteria bacterium]|nr:acyl-CoA dehydrogenase family protein [Gammaproteobacteria bacterium]
MADHDHMLLDAAERIFADLCDKAALDAAERGEFPLPLWTTLAENGFPTLAMPDSGAELGDAFALIRLAGRYAVPVPLAETLLANRWLGSADGVSSIGRVAGQQVVDVPWGRQAETVLGLDADAGAFVRVSCDPGAADVERGYNLAGEPRDALTIPSGTEWIALSEPALAFLALARACAMAGALERLLALSLQYANEREQFGRPIARFQAIQHNLAVMAGEVAAAQRAADAAVEALQGERFELEVAAAKARVGEAAGVAAEIAHQVHGAMGYTYEHQLHHFTRRAWAWRDEYGGETYWQQRLGAHVAASGADALWPFLATRG